MSDDFPHLDHLTHQSLVRVATTPDVFGYYRPIPQASLLVQLQAGAPAAVAFRGLNLLLHLCVIALAFLAARRLLDDEDAAFLAALAFALTPKAHTQAVLWVSARAEFLMAIFALAAVIAWVRWTRDGGARWAAAAWGCAVAAMLCKESAVLLPLALLAMPPRSSWSVRRAALAGAMLAGVAGLLALRVVIGARLPTADPSYELFSPARAVASYGNYLARAAAAPVALIVAATLAAGRAPRGARPASLGAVAACGLAWFSALLLPVLPMPGRSELYLYLPVFGPCLVAGAVARWRLGPLSQPRARVALVVVALALGGYQASRAAHGHEAAVFSARFAEAVRGNAALRAHVGPVSLQPADAATEQALRDTVHGYLEPALKVILGRPDISGVVLYANEVHEPGGLRLLCTQQAGSVDLVMIEAPR